MSSQDDFGDEVGNGLSGIACESCRTRKAKCDRRLPECFVCKNHSQTCVYPATRLKPGPKLGSSQQHRRAIKEGRDRIDNASNASKRRRRDEGTCALERSRSTSVMTRDCHAISVPNPGHRTARLPSETQIGRGVSRSYEPMSPEGTVGAALNSATDTPHDRIQLSSIIHPTHEAHLATPDEDNYESPTRVTVAPGAFDAFPHTCSALQVSSSTLQDSIKSYFANMTAFSFFHQPSFYATVQNIPSPTDLQALLAAILSFSVRFENCLSTQRPAGRAFGGLSSTQGHEYFHNLALDLIDAAVKDCRDEAPSLQLLQALVLTTFYQLTNGVRGRAWRALGLCVRIAYEQRLHLIDANKIDNASEDMVEESRWCYDEERRRIWWAIWEMDVFASIIRRCPTAIDWSHNETFLPATDDAWFSSRYESSCRLSSSAPDRWKALRDCESKSPWAWFIVVNSFARDAEHLTSQQAALKKTNSQIPPSSSSRLSDIEDQITILGHSLRCLTSALPEILKYHGEHLSFTSWYPEEALPSRRLHASKYSIHIMTQLTKFMLYHHSAFCDKTNSSDVASQKPSAREGLSRYLEAADEIIMAVSHSAENHVRYVNPFLASTIWLATAAQLVSESLTPQLARKDLIHSKFDLLRLNCQQHNRFWNTPVALLENLDALQEHLPGMQRGQRTGKGRSCRERSSLRHRDNAQEARRNSKTMNISSLDASRASVGPPSASQAAPVDLSREATEDTTIIGYHLANAVTGSSSAMSGITSVVGLGTQQPLPHLDIGDRSVPYDSTMQGTGWEELDFESSKDIASRSFLNDILWESYAGV